MKAKNINTLALFEISFLRMKKITLKEKNLPHFPCEMDLGIPRNKRCEFSR